MENKKQVWPTTVDNPFDPFLQWKRWYRFDELFGYHTCERLATIMRPSNHLADVEWDDAFEQACRTLIHFYDPFEVYVLAVEGETKLFGCSKDAKAS